MHLLVRDCDGVFGVAFDGVATSGTLRAREIRRPYQVATDARGAEPEGFVLTADGLRVRTESHREVWALADRKASVVALAIEVPVQDADLDPQTPREGEESKAELPLVATRQLGLFKNR